MLASLYSMENTSFCPHGEEKTSWEIFTWRERDSQRNNPKSGRGDFSTKYYPWGGECSWQRIHLTSGLQLEEATNQTGVIIKMSTTLQLSLTPKTVDSLTADVIFGVTGPTWTNKTLCIFVQRTCCESASSEKDEVGDDKWRKAKWIDGSVLWTNMSYQKKKSAVSSIVLEY